MEIFEKALEVENLPKIRLVVTVRKNPILGIAITKINKTFTAMKDKLNTHFGVISKYFHQSSVCPIIMQKAWFEIYLRFFRNQTYRCFYSCIFDVQYTIVSDTGVSFFTSNLIRVEFKFN